MDARSPAARRELLVARCELERLQLAHALHDVRTIVRPPRAPGSRARSRAAMLLRFALPLLGASRVAKFVRALSWGVMAVRAVSAWRAR